MRILSIIPFNANYEFLVKSKQEDRKFLQTLPSEVVRSYEDALEILQHHRFSYDLILTTYSPNHWLPAKDRVGGTNDRDYYTSSRHFVSRMLLDNPFARILLWTGSGKEVLSHEMVINDRILVFDRSDPSVLGGQEGRTETEMQNLRSAIVNSFTECRLSLTDENKLVIEGVCGRSPISIVGTDSPAIMPVRFYLNRAFGSLEDKIREFEDIVNKPGVSEGEIELFLRSHPLFLLGQRYKSLRWQIHLKRTMESKGDLIPDIILEPVNPTDVWKIQDLKLPTAKIVRSMGPNREGFGLEVLKAMHQLREYRDFFDNPIYREQLAELGIFAYKPQISVLIGRDYGGLSTEQLIKARGDFADLEVMTYPELIQHIRSNLMWMSRMIDTSVSRIHDRAF